MPTLCSTCNKERAALRRPKTLEPVREDGMGLGHSSPATPTQQTVPRRCAALRCISLCAAAPDSRGRASQPTQQPATFRRRPVPSDLPRVLLRGARGRGAPNDCGPPPVLPRRARRRRRVGRQGLDGARAHAHAAQRAPRVRGAVQLYVYMTTGTATGATARSEAAETGGAKTTQNTHPTHKQQQQLLQTHNNTITTTQRSTNRTATASTSSCCRSTRASRGTATTRWRRSSATRRRTASR